MITTNRCRLQVPYEILPASGTENVIVGSGADGLIGTDAVLEEQIMSSA
jgi:hypothetical protein